MQDLSKSAKLGTVIHETCGHLRSRAMCIGCPRCFLPTASLGWAELHLSAGSNSLLCDRRLRHRRFCFNWCAALLLQRLRCHAGDAGGARAGSGAGVARVHPEGGSRATPQQGQAKSWLIGRLRRQTSARGSAGGPRIHPEGGSRAAPRQGQAEGWLNGWLHR